MREKFLFTVEIMIKTGTVWDGLIEVEPLINASEIAVLGLEV